MKVRITILTENDKPRTDDISEEKVKKAWQTIFDFILLSSADPSEKVLVEKAEFVED